MAAILALLAFAVTAAVEALKGAPLRTAVPRMILAALVMAALGWLAGIVAETAVREAVDAKLPPVVEDEVRKPGETDITETEEE